MKKLLYIALSILFLTGCGSSGKEKGNADSAQDTAIALDSAAVAAMEAAAKQARQDSIIAAALEGDSLKEKHILVNKELFTLFVREDDKTLFTAPVCIGRGIGQKKGKGDSKTPEGEYKIRSIEVASGWTYDFHDGKGKTKGAYGPWFFRLNTPQSTHIGIHGTLFPETMGTRQSDGCVRMRNEDLEQLRKYVFVGMKVVITPDKV